MWHASDRNICLKDFYREIWKEDLGVGGSIILKRNLEKRWESVDYVHQTKDMAKTEDSFEYDN
jgi:hypothetical protein